MKDITNRYERLKPIYELDNINSDRLIAEIETLPLKRETFKGKPTSRQYVWLGRKQINYDTNNPSSIKSNLRIEDNPIFYFLRDYYYPEANSILIYRYDIGGEISEHCDKGLKHRKVVSINLLDCPYNLFGEKDEVTKFVWGKNVITLFDGDVIAFDALVSHGVMRVKCIRYSLQFRCVKED